MQGKVGDLWPQARSNHAACCLNFGEEYPQVFMSGGMTDDRVLNDAWLFNVKIKKWNIVSMPFHTCQETLNIMLIFLNDCTIR